MSPIIDNMKLSGSPVKRFFQILIAIIVFSIFFDAFGTVGAGERGVHLRFNAVTGKTLGEGLYFKIPFIEDVKIVSIKIQKISSSADAASKDLQTVEATIALNYHIEPESAVYIYQNVARNYEDEIIAPAIQEAVKAGTAIFNAEELITKRATVRDVMKDNINEKLNKHGIIIDEFNIEDFSFSESFDASVENKVTAEQEALAAKNKLEQIKFEAQQKIEAAKGSAEAITIEAQALENNPQVLELRAIEKWDGVLPKVVGEQATPFIDVNSL